MPRLISYSDGMCVGKGSQASELKSGRAWQAATVPRQPISLWFCAQLKKHGMHGNGMAMAMAWGSVS